MVCLWATGADVHGGVGGREAGKEEQNSTYDGGSTEGVSELWLSS